MIHLDQDEYNIGAFYSYTNQPVLRVSTHSSSTPGVVVVIIPGIICAIRNYRIKFRHEDACFCC